MQKARPGFERENLAKGASEQAIARFKSQIGVELPEAFYALYRWHDGSKRGAKASDGFDFSADFEPLASVLSSKATMDSLEADGTWKTWLPGQWWNPAWVPFFSNHSYDMWCVDTEGCFDGVPGQILQWSKDGPSRPILFPSIEAWLETLVARVTAGAWPVTSEDWQRGQLAEAINQRICSGYPKRVAARSVRSTGAVPELPNVRRPSEAMPITKRFWAPDGSCVNALAVSPDGTRALLAMGPSSKADKASIAEIDLETGRVVRELRRGNHVRAVAYGCDGRVVFVRNDSALELVTCRDGDEELVIAAADVRSNLTFSLDRVGKTVVWASDAIRAYDVATGKVKLELPAPTSVPETSWMAAVSASGELYAVHDGTVVRLYDATARELRQLAGAPERLGLLRFDPTARWLFAAGEYGSGPFVWDVESGRRRPGDDLDDGLDGDVCDLAVAPDGARFVTGGFYGSVRLRLTATLEEVGNDEPHNRMTCVTFTPDGAHVVSAADEGTVVVRLIA